MNYLMRVLILGGYLLPLNPESLAPKVERWRLVTLVLPYPNRQDVIGLKVSLGLATAHGERLFHARRTHLWNTLSSTLHLPEIPARV